MASAPQLLFTKPKREGLWLYVLGFLFAMSLHVAGAVGASNAKRVKINQQVRRIDLIRFASFLF